MISLTAQPQPSSIYASNSLWKDRKSQLAWVQLNGLDGLPRIFWRTFTGALTVWDLEFAQRQKQQGFPASAEQYALFVGELEQRLTDNPLMLVVNNIQWITGSETHDFLLRLVGLDVSGLFVTLLTDNLSDEASKESISNVQADKYRCFTAEEERQYYRSASLTLSEEEFLKVHGFTDGWATAVAVIAEHLLRGDQKRILDSFAAYLHKWIERVYFDQYEKEEQLVFCLLTLLDEFPMEMLQSFTGWDGETLLRVLESSPFIRFNLETNRFFYGFYCKSYLQKHQLLLDNRERRDFYLRAGDWYREHGEKIEAVWCYRQVGANNKILQVMKQWEFPNSRELAKCYIETINTMPQSFVDKHPLLQVIRCHMLCTLYRYEEASLLLAGFCAEHDQDGDIPGDLRPVLGEAYLLRANANTYLMHVSDDTVRLFKRAAELLPDGSTMVSSRVNFFSDSPIVRLPSPAAGSMRQYCELLFETEPYIDRVSGGHGNGCAHLAAAELRFYTRDFREMEIHARKAIVTALRHDQFDVACSACFALMRMNLAKGNYGNTMESSSLLEQYAAQARYDGFFSMPDVAAAWLSIKLGKHNEVADWIRDEALYQKRVTPWGCGRDMVIRCNYLLANQLYEETLAYAHAGIDMMENRSYHLLALFMQVMKAIAYAQLGEGGKAANELAGIYHWSHGNGLVMPLVEFGGQIRPLIETYRKSGRDEIPEAWLEDIGKKAKSYYVYQYNIRKQHEKKQYGNSTPLDGLSGSELKLLLMITRGMTSRQIAELQGRSVSAVKGMCRRVYTKIGAEGMADAVRIATQCGIEEQVDL